ncbi:uncharacterized protein LOC120351617 [Nilaparvata lugens]|uniref:uncharacterized protein LOC120351617 n=1 Tax=Nilaparvata lugens TaxID=108931 RepID=UPI00193E08F0|nr:uncharacterized protein LOC120351617 [Nilaparvata lugens]
MHIIIAIAINMLCKNKTSSGNIKALSVMSLLAFICCVSITFVAIIIVCVCVCMLMDSQQSPETAAAAAASTFILEEDIMDYEANVADSTSPPTKLFCGDQATPKLGKGHGQIILDQKRWMQKHGVGRGQRILTPAEEGEYWIVKK